MTAPDLAATAAPSTDGAPSTSGASGTSGIEPQVVAAFVAALHRFTAEETVEVVCRTADADSRTVTACFADAPAFAALIDRVGQELAPDRPEGAEPAVVTSMAPVTSVVFGPERGGVVLVRDDGAAGPPRRWPYRVLATGPAGALPAADLDDALRVAAADGTREPGRPAAELGLTDDEQRWYALGTGAATPPPARCVHELVAEQATRSPRTVAVSQGDETLTYAELEARAAALAHRMRVQGVVEGDVVAVLQRRSPSIVVTLLAVLKAGAAYLAIDAQDTPARHARLIGESGARLVVTEHALRDRVPDGFRALDLDDGGTGPEEQRHGPTAPATLSASARQSPDTLAYVGFTSGTTGEPRGVGVPHRAVARLVRDPNWMDIRDDDVFLQLAPIAFDASTLEIWAPLVNGCRLAIAPDGALDLDQLAAVLKREAVTVLWLTAGLFHRMAANRPDALEGVRHLVAGGDVILPGLLERLLESRPDLLFTNGYGPTENTTFTTCWTAPAGWSGETVPIGRPVTGTRVAVLDPALRPVPAGFWGELYASGDGLARGYVNSAAATAEHFLPDVFSGVPGARMYRTGDLARWSADGVLEFLGRADHQLKIQGYRVEPSHVEAELTRLPAVRDAVVVAQSDDAGGKRLLAYVVMTDEAGADPDVRLREQLRPTLPPYSVPWAIVVVGALPLKANGKVDRRALPSASRVPRNVGDAFVEPRDAVERRLAALWGEVLGVEPIGVEDDFFDLGGHSLLAAELLGTLKEGYGVEVPARVLYLQPTIAELARHLRD
ncbi:amino acid adenylation domain-containing protein [Streptomyces sp. TRM75563]|uniref:amino acid adenylation domain-containing protein n=1 Tax=Streptomyces sp. TRM75563 TaxID=2817418 RepID=UPI001F60CB7E|nr:amino acid adenylation domain-containing protein [Streptomyces sp. TRM75563]MCI4042793.1 amino acid adenylation domain-containing protein [Streptomyces sp. TRM75563]